MGFDVGLWDSNPCNYHDRQVLNEHWYLMASESVTVKLNLSFVLNLKVLKTEVLRVHVRLFLTLGSSIPRPILAK